MANEDYAKGYNDGFRAGLEAGRGLNPLPSSPYNPPEPWSNNSKGITCKVCGMFFEHGKAYGFSCSNSDCPTSLRATCITVANTTWSSWMGVRSTS